MNDRLLSLVINTEEEWCKAQSKLIRAGAVWINGKFSIDFPRPLSRINIYVYRTICGLSLSYETHSKGISVEEFMLLDLESFLFDKLL